MAESTRHHGEKPPPTAREHERMGPDPTGEFTTSAQGQGETVGEARGDREGRNLNGHCPDPQIHIGLQRQKQRKGGSSSGHPKTG